MGFIAQGKLGSKDLSSLKKRKDLPVELRQLWGEYDDARVNYARSVSKMAFLVANHQFLREVRRVGDHNFLFDRPIVRDGVEYKAQIAGDKSKTLEPLNGFYTSPEIKQAFEDALGDPQIPDWLRIYMKANGFVKFSKTVLSPMTHVRNVVGNLGFAVANGHWRAISLKGGVQTALTNLGTLTNEQFRRYSRALTELGVLHESARAGELQDVIKEASKDINTFADNWVVRTLARTKEGITNVYQTEDDIWKVFAFENEYARYRKAYPDWTEKQVKEKAASIVRRTYPTYSLVPRGVKALRRFPLTGAFVSFPAEVIRTAHNTLKLIAEEMSDPTTKAIAAQRLAGVMLATSGTYAASLGTMALLGIGADEDEDLRRFMAPWDKNADLFYLGTDDAGKKRFINLGFTDPHSYLKAPIMAFLRGEDWEKASFEAATEVFEPFFGEEILAGALLDIARTTKTGKDLAGEDIAKKLYETFEPGAVTSGRRIYMGATGQVTEYGRSYDTKDEILSVATGMRRQTVDIPQSLQFKARQTQQLFTNASKELGSVFKRKGNVTDKDKQEAYDEMVEAKKLAWEEVRKDVSAARRLGLSDLKIRQSLIDGGISRQNAEMLVKGMDYKEKPIQHYLRSRQ
jgi:head-tail adaptor